MTIKIEELALAVSKNIPIEEYVALLCKADGCEYLFRSSTFVNTDISLKIRGYLDNNNSINNKGKALIEEISGIKGVSNKVDNKYEKLHKQLQAELTALTTKKQKLLQGKYQFLPNLQDFSTRLNKIVKKYKLDDWERVEKLLIAYIYKCHKANWEYVQTIEYYIEKLGSSKLATDYNNDDVTQEVEVKKGDTFNI